MRDLTIDEREIVAGGWNSLYWLDDVDVTGRRYYLEDMSWFEAYLGGSSGEGGGGGGGEDSPEKPPEEKCVGSQPSGVSLSDMHKAAINLKAVELAAGNSIYENAAQL